MAKPRDHQAQKPQWMKNRQKQLTQWVGGLRDEWLAGLTPAEAKILLSYSGNFQDGRYFITDQDGVEIDPFALSPTCVREFWRRIAGCVQALLNLPVDCPVGCNLTA